MNIQLDKIIIYGYVCVSLQHQINSVKHPRVQLIATFWINKYYFAVSIAIT